VRRVSDRHILIVDRDNRHLYETATSIRPYIAPARRQARGRMGARLRLKAGTDLSGYRPELQRIFRAMQRYGLIVADNGSEKTPGVGLHHLQPCRYLSPRDR
jgi:hypothetical protein